MKPPVFDYVAAESAVHAAELLGEHHGEAKILAGGQSLVPMLNFRLLQPAVLVDINKIAGLAGIAESDQGLRIGALTRHHAVETSELVARHFPVLHAAMRHVAHLAIRNRGSFGGSLAHADPAAELPMLALLLEADISVRGPAGTRSIAARDFFVDTLTTCLGAAELVTEVQLPFLPAATGWGFHEVARRHGDYAIAAASALIARSGNRIGEARIAVMGVDATAKRLTELEEMLTGQPFEPDMANGIAARAREAVQPSTDLHASADYRRHLAGELVGRALADAWRRAGADA